MTSDRPVKLAHIWSSDIGAAGSLPRLRHFVGRGWDVYVIAPDGPLLEWVRAAGVTHLPMRLSRTFVDPLGAVWAGAEIARYCRRYRFDIVHTHNIKSGMVGRVMARLVGMPRVLHTMHGMSFGDESPPLRRAIHAGLERLAAYFGDHILVQSERDYDTMVRHRIGAGTLLRIGNGIPLDRFDPGSREAIAGRAAVRAELGLADDDVLFLSAGRLVKAKGFLELGEATGLARAADPRVHCAIAGPIDHAKLDVLTPTEMDRVRAGGVRFLGARRDMPAVIAAADVIALPSWHEGLPRFLLEGAAMAKPLLATRCRGCAEVVVEPDGGALVPIRDAEALAGAMRALAADPAWRASAGAFNRPRAVAEYDLRAVIARIEAVYAQMLAEVP